MDIKTAPFYGPFGDHELTVTVYSYAVNKRLAVNLLCKNAFDMEKLREFNPQGTVKYLRQFQQHQQESRAFKGKER